MASDASPFGSLTVSSPSAGFQQQGSWDMVNIAKMPITATLGALSRFAAGGVNPYTPLVGQTICKAFRLKQQGRENIKKALSKLPWCSTLGSALYIGFGIEHLVRIMATTEEGTICLALCAALVECFNYGSAADVLLEVGRRCSIEARYLPSSSEWEALLKCCAGVLAATDFPLRCAHFRGLNGRHQGRWRPSTPESLADALLGPSKVTRGESVAVTLVGGPDAGWLAAVAEWVFSLDVTIKGSSGDVLYSNHQKDISQVTVVFQAESGSSAQCLRIDSQTFLLNTATSLLHRDQNLDHSRGRVAWDTALSQTFGVAFEALVSTPELLGQALGSAARIFQAISNAEDYACPTYERAVQDNMHYSARSYGRGFVSNTIRWFPELECCEKSMKKCAELTLVEAMSTYTESVVELWRCCICSHCRQHIPSLQTLDEYEFCLAILLETLIKLSRLLSSCEVQEQLCPSHSGLEIAYDDQASTSQRMNRDRRACCQDLGLICSFSLCSDRPDARPLEDALKLFTNQDDRGDPDVFGNKAAKSYSGICVYLEVLTNASEDLVSLSNVHVTTGRIQLDGKYNDILRDEESSCQEDYTMVDAICADDTGPRRPALYVTERSRYLTCVLSFQVADDKRGLVWNPTIGPAELAKISLQGRGRVRCSHNSNGHIQRPSNIERVSPKVHQYEETLCKRSTFWPVKSSD